MPTIRRDEILGFKPGKTIGHYEMLSNGDVTEAGLLRPLGKGGSGVVFLANQKLDGDITVKRAIKFFVFDDKLLEEHEELAASGPVSATNFKNEIANLSSFNHENIIKVIEAGIWKPDGLPLEIPYLVTELIDGPNLEQVIEDGKLPELLKGHLHLVIDLILMICKGICYLHSREFYHCDIAPKNIFVDGSPPDVRLIIGDLGVGRSTKTATADTSFLIAGTKAYSSPEVLPHRNKQVKLDIFLKLQPRWDLYGVAKTAWAMAKSIDDFQDTLRPWHQPLVERLLDTYQGSRVLTVHQLSEHVQWLWSIRHTMERIPELSEAHPNNRQRLFPVESVTVSDRIYSIINHPAVLRLKHVPQLVMSSAVFPANHTRYEHSVGTYQVARQMLRALMDDEGFLAACDAQGVEMALVASLLSNVTRFAFSTIIQEIRGSDKSLYASFSQASLVGEAIRYEYGGSEKSLLDVLTRKFPEIDANRLEGILETRSFSTATKKAVLCTFC